MLRTLWQRMVGRSGNAPRGARPGSRSPRRARIEVEQLELRLVPVVGSTAEAMAVNPGQGYDGVVRLTLAGGGTCSGTLLWTNMHVLTAAHCVDTDGDREVDGNTTVTFHLAAQTVTRGVRPNRVALHPNWDGNAFNGRDLAILRLPGRVPGVTGFNLYTNGDEIDDDGKTFTLVGYGRTGTGLLGSNVAAGQKRKAENIYDETGSKLNTDPLRTDPNFERVLNRLGTSVREANGSLPFNDPLPNGADQLVYDFDHNTSDDFDAMKHFYDITRNLNPRTREGFAAPGDSGGPGFIRVGTQDRIASVVSFGFGFTAAPDVRPNTNDSFGEIEVDTRVSSYVNWIRDTVRIKLASLSPTSGPSSGGTMVTLLGDNLAATTEVFFGTTPTPFTIYYDEYTDEESIVAFSPEHSPGTVHVRLMDESGELSEISYFDEFTYYFLVIDIIDDEDRRLPGELVAE